jgi:ribosomal protein S18 acetylase RimI-like enzyme
MTFEIIPATEISLADQAIVANAAFAGYVAGWTEMDANALARFLCLQGADLCYSRFVRTSEGLAGFGYINRTGNILRLGGMAVIPSARGTGAAKHLLLQMLEEGRSRGDTAMVLEVIEQNPRAVALYRREGFRQIGHLIGWRRPVNSGVSDVPAVLQKVPILRALQMQTARDYPEIPWAISQQANAKVEKTQAFQTESTCIVISDPAAPKIRVHGLFSPFENWPHLRAALAGVLQQFPDREFFAPPVWPEEFGVEVFEPLRFSREPLSQFLMRQEL